MFPDQNLVIAVDFDGTIVEHRFPAIGKEIPFAIHTLIELNKRGFRLILWTFRNGELLDKAVAFCRERGLEFYCVNKSYPEEEPDPTISRKIDADIFIDDRNIGGMLPWNEIYRILCPEDNEHQLKFKKKSFFERLMP
jgi:hypothetical protein